MKTAVQSAEYRLYRGQQALPAMSGRFSQLTAHLTFCPAPLPCSAPDFISGQVNHYKVVDCLLQKICITVGELHIAQQSQAQGQGQGQTTLA